MELFNLFLGNVSEGKRGEKKPEQNCVVPTSLVAQMVKCLSTMRETWVLSLGREDPLEKEMTIHSSAIALEKEMTINPSTIAWEIPWTEEPGRLQSMGSQRIVHD